MAQQVTVTTIDDLDQQTPGAKSVSFSLDNQDYEIDLAPDNEAKLRDAVADFIAKARKVSGKAKPAKVSGAGSRSGGKYTREQLKEIRDWAVSHGGRVGDRGRLPDVVAQAFEAKDPSRLPQMATVANG